MDKSNLELFKQAISEGLSNKTDRIASDCSEEIVCSEKHTIAMRTIVYGEIDASTAKRPRARRIIAILVALALLLTSCGLLFRSEIRVIFEDLFAKVTYRSDDIRGGTVEGVYQLGYLPEGYSLQYKKIRAVRVQYRFENQDGERIWFEQRPIDTTNFVVDTESSYSKIDEIENYEIYYRYADEKHIFVWNDGKHSMKILSSAELSNDEILLILEGMTIQ